MINEPLRQYIESVQSQGFPESTIREVLAKNGWQLNDVNEAFSFIQQKKELAATQPQSNQPTTPTTQNKYIYKKTVEYNSPFSVGLAIVLLLAIMILLNKVIDDAKLFTNTINGELIFDALIILPFLILAYIFHESFSGTGKRYLLVSQPYFAVSAVLLVRLLWDTSKYVLNANAAYGVYIVLILIILVLTGAIFFVQKYIKSNNQ